MKNHIRKCNNCKYFDAYFIKGRKRFNQTKCGWCIANKENADVDGWCTRYEEKRPVKSGQKYLYRYLSDILTDISAIRDVIEANYIGETTDNEEM